jgi:hypothetical protein
MYCETTYKKIQDVLLLVDAAIMHVALLWALHSSGYDSKQLTAVVYVAFWRSGLLWHGRLPVILDL